MTVTWPTADTRWRCSQCGNKTRFDVVRSSRVKEYVHLDLSGKPEVEETEVLSETLEQVRVNAPATTLTLGRVVSLKDYEDFARAFADAYPSFTVLGFHPSFAAIILLFWLLPTLLMGFGFEWVKDRWLSSGQWEEYLHRVHEAAAEERGEAGSE